MTRRILKNEQNEDDKLRKGVRMTTGKDKRFYTSFIKAGKRLERSFIVVEIFMKDFSLAMLSLSISVFASLFVCGRFLVILSRPSSKEIKVWQ